MTGRARELDVFAPPSLAERLTASVAQLRERAEAASRGGALTAGGLAASIARDLEALLDDTRQARGPGGSRPGSLSAPTRGYRHDSTAAESAASAARGPCKGKTEACGGPGATIADPRGVGDGRP